MDMDEDEASHINAGENSDVGSSENESNNKPMPSVEKNNNGGFKPFKFGSGSIMKQLRQMGLLNNSKKRAATRQHMIGGATAFIDQDNSGDYDPTKEKRAARRKPSRRRAKVVVERLAHEGDKDNTTSKRSPKATAFDGMVKLTLKSQGGLTGLRSITPGSDSNGEIFDEGKEEPGDHDETANSGGRRRTRIVKIKTTIPQRDDGLTFEQLTIDHPQSRGCKTCFVARNDDCILIDDDHDYACEACNDADVDCELIIPLKLKRDCVRCESKSIQCSYRCTRGKGKTACKACEDQDLNCIVDPLEESNRIINDVLTQSTPKRQKLRAPRSPSPSPPSVRPRQYIWCNQCRNTPGRRCSLRTKQDTGPCKNCRQSNQHCQFVYIPASQLAALAEKEANRIKSRRSKGHKSQVKTAANHKRARRDDGVEDSLGIQTEKIYSELEQKVVKRQKRLGNNRGKNTTHSQFQSQSSQLCNITLRSGKSRSQSYAPSSANINTHGEGNAVSMQLIGFTSGNRHIFITTAFCHPIRFNYIPDPATKHPCSWCFDPLFGLHGLLPDYDLVNPLRVEGFYEPNGHGFEEVMGGFAERGAKQSFMCIECTSARVDVLSCQNHAIRQLTVVEKNDWAYSYEKFKKSSEAWLEGDMVGARYFTDAKWCSICPNFAEFKCAAPGEDDLGSREHEHAYEDEQGGCGMLLCANCAELAEKLIVGELNGQRLVDGLVREVKTQIWQFEDGVRADATFLTSEGELLARLILGFGEDDRFAESGVGSLSGENSLGSGSGNRAKSIPPTLQE